MNPVAPNQIQHTNSNPFTALRAFTGLKCKDVVLLAGHCKEHLRHENAHIFVGGYPGTVSLICALAFSVFSFGRFLTNRGSESVYENREWVECTGNVHSAIKNLNQETPDYRVLDFAANCNIKGVKICVRNCYGLEFVSFLQELLIGVSLAVLMLYFLDFTRRRMNLNEIRSLDKLSQDLKGRYEDLGLIETEDLKSILNAFDLHQAQLVRLMNFEQLAAAAPILGQDKFQRYIDRFSMEPHNEWRILLQLSKESEAANLTERLRSPMVQALSRLKPSFRLKLCDLLSRHPNSDVNKEIKRLRWLYLNPEDPKLASSSLRIVVNGVHEIWANCQHLAQNAIFFRSLIQSGMKETKSGELNITEDDHESFIELMNVLALKIPKLNLDLALKILPLADKYCVAKVLYEIDVFLSQIPSPTSEEQSIEILQEFSALKKLRQTLEDKLLSRRVNSPTIAKKHYKLGRQLSMTRLVEKCKAIVRNHVNLTITESYTQPAKCDYNWLKVALKLLSHAEFSHLLEGIKERLNYDNLIVYFVIANSLNHEPLKEICLNFCKRDPEEARKHLSRYLENLPLDFLNLLYPDSNLIDVSQLSGSY